MADLRGHLSLRAAVRERGRTIIEAQSFRAPYHLSKSYWDADAGVLLAQVVNPTAGILSGDCLESDIAVRPGAALLVTTPSACRVFQMRENGAVCRQQFTVAAGGWLEFSPEPLVPHRGSRFQQATTIQVEAGGNLFYFEQLMPGRIGHGEAWLWDRLCLTLDVRCANELVLRERLDQSGAQLQSLAETAGAGQIACIASGVVMVGEPGDAGWMCEAAKLHGTDAWFGMSALRRDVWSVKIVARSSLILRDKLQALRRILSVRLPWLACGTRKF